MAGLKYVGYLLAGLGALAVILSLANIKEKISALDPISGKILLIIGIGILAVGVVLMIVFDKGGRGGQVKQEVPIFKGKEIVGYRQAN
jgi:uncharacterized protein YjeT (DUF2065 family)